MTGALSGAICSICRAYIGSNLHLPIVPRQQAAGAVTSAYADWFLALSSSCGSGIGSHRHVPTWFLTIRTLLLPGYEAAPQPTRHVTGSRPIQACSVIVPDRFLRRNWYFIKILIQINPHSKLNRNIFWVKASKQLAVGKWTIVARNAIYSIGCRNGKGNRCYVKRWISIWAENLKCLLF